jgi:hypothetical protein
MFKSKNIEEALLEEANVNETLFNVKKLAKEQINVSKLVSKCLSNQKNQIWRPTKVEFSKKILDFMIQRGYTN